MEQNHFSNFGRGSPKEHFCEIILKLDHWPRRRCRLKVFFFFFFFLALLAILFSRAEPFQAVKCILVQNIYSGLKKIENLWEIYRKKIGNL